MRKRSLWGRHFWVWITPGIFLLLVIPLLFLFTGRDDRVGAVQFIGLIGFALWTVWLTEGSKHVRFIHRLLYGSD